MTESRYANSIAAATVVASASHLKRTAAVRWIGCAILSVLAAPQCERRSDTPSPQHVASVPESSPAAITTGTARVQTPDPGVVRKAIARALDASDQSAAAVVVSVDSARLVGIGDRRGADARIALRPGSTVKPLLAVVAATEGVLDAHDRVRCDGRYHGVPGLRCSATHGELGLSQALASSCNVFFFELAHRLGFARVERGFAEFGLGTRTGLVSGEQAGTLPSPASIAASAASAVERDQLSLSSAIGHGRLEVTPLQLAAAYARLARLLSERPSRLPEPQRAEIAAGLRDAVATPQGTAHRAAVDGLPISGRTGTAEPGKFGDSSAAGQQENGWFVGFAPSEAPVLVIAVVVLGGGGGGESAAPIAARIFRDTLR